MTLARRAHPFTAGSVALALIALALILPTATDTIVLYLMVVVLAYITGAGAGIRKALLIVAPIWILLFILQVVLGDPPRIPAPWGNISAPGLQWAMSQGSRLAAIVTASLAFAVTFDPHRFLQATIQRRWPFGAAFLLVATLDAADRLAHQATQLREAQRTRGVRVTGSLGVRARSVPALVFPLLLASLTEADDRALALETRGLLIVGPRTALDPPADSISDRIVRWGALLLVVAVLAWRFAR